MRGLTPTAARFPRSGAQGSGLSGIQRFRSRFPRHTFAAERSASGALAAHRTLVGGNTSRATERHRTSRDDLLQHEALRLVQYRAQAQGQGWSGEGAPQLLE